MIYLVKRQYELVESGIYKLATVRQFEEWVLDKPILQVDTETEGDFDFAHKALTLQIGTFEDQWIFVIADLTFDEIELISKVCLNNPNKLKLLHNSKYDIKYLWFHQFSICNTYDTMLGELLLSAGISDDVAAAAYSVSLKSISEVYLGVTMDKSIRGNINYLGLTDRVIQYAADDVKYLEKIYHLQYEKIVKEGLENVCKLENECVYAFAMIEYTGLKIDKTGWEIYTNKVKESLDESKRQLDEYVINTPELRKFWSWETSLFEKEKKVCTVNWASPAQKMKVFAACGLKMDGSGVRERMKYRTHPLIKFIDTYVRESKAYTSFALKIPTYINKVTGRIHTSFWTILSTGRVSSKDPNIQQFPNKGELGKLVRAAIVAEDNYLILSGDYSQCELRIIASLSKDPLWLQSFQEGKDLHTVLACKTFNIEEDKVKTAPDFKKDTTYRDVQKTINFGLAYGMSKYKLADTIGVSEDTAESIINKFFAEVPYVKKFLDFCAKYGVQYGYMRTPKPFARKRYFVFDADDFKSRGEVERKSKNFPIQGCNADITKLALARMYTFIQENKLDVKIINQVHDEIVCEAHESIADMWAVEMKRIMLEAWSYVIKDLGINVDIKVSKKWEK